VIYDVFVIVDAFEFCTFYNVQLYFSTDKTWTYPYL